MKLRSNMNRCLLACLLAGLILTQCRNRKQAGRTAIPDKPPVSLQVNSTGTWQPLGPFGAPQPMAEPGEMSPHGAGRFMCINLHPGNEGEILAGHATSGLFKSTDNGRTWQQKLDFPFSTGIFRILRFTKNSKHLIACSGMDIGSSRQYGYGLIESFDNGETWQRNSLQFDPEEYNLRQSRDVAIIDSKKEKRLLSISDREIYASEDGALTWTKVHDSKFSLKSIVVNPFDDNSIFVCGSGLLYSADGGKSWQNITNYTSKAYGKENSEFARFQVAFSQKTKDKYYVAAEDQSVYILERTTHDTGEYRILNRNACVINVQRLVFAANYNPKTKLETLYLGSIRLHKSIDGGINFPQITVPLNAQPNSVHDDINSIAFHNNSVYVTTDGGIDVSSDEGRTWLTLSGNSLNLNTALVFGFDKSMKGYMMCGTQDNGVFTLKSGTWLCSKLYGDGGRVTALNDSTGFATGYAQANYTTKNAGVTFEYKHAGHERTGFDFRMNFREKSGTFYLANTHLYKRKDNRYFEILTSKLSADRKIKAFWVNPGNENEIWLARDEPTWGGELLGKLFYTSDGGVTWLDHTNRLPILSWRTITDIHVNRQGQIAVTLEAFDKKNSEIHKVYMSLDGGYTFINASNGLPNVPANTIIFANEHWICGNNNGIYIMRGDKWEPYGNGFPATIVTELKYFEDAGILYASTFGRGIWGMKL
jgi:photosystem II stability/assembly factor-like uncharacterized protein